MGIKSENTGIIHCIANCSQCGRKACVFTGKRPTMGDVISEKSIFEQQGAKLPLNSSPQRAFY